MPISPAILSKRYAGRRLYHTGTTTDPTLDGPVRMVEDAGDFAVREAGTGEDVASSILQDIIRRRALHG